MKIIEEKAVLLNGRQAAALLGISKQSLRAVVEAGALPQIKVPGLGAPRYARSDVEALVRGVEASE